MGAMAEHDARLEGFLVAFETYGIYVNHQSVFGLARLRSDLSPADALMTEVRGWSKWPDPKVTVAEEDVGLMRLADEFDQRAFSFLDDPSSDRRSQGDRDELAREHVRGQFVRLVRAAVRDDHPRVVRVDIDLDVHDMIVQSQWLVSSATDRLWLWFGWFD